MPTNHDETLLERYTREAEIDARMLAKLEMVSVPRAQLEAIHRDLGACQKVMRLVGGFDPSYCRRAQARLKEIDALLAQPVADEQGEQQPVAWPEFVERAAQILDAEQERLSAEDYLMDSDDCIKVLRETVAAPIAQAAPQPEQSGLAGHVCGGDAGHNTVNIQLVDRAPWGDLRIGAPVTLAALSAQGDDT